MKIQPLTVICKGSKPDNDRARYRNYNGTIWQVMLLGITVFIAGCNAGPATYYVSPEGDDAARGTTEKTAWRTPDRVNRARLGPGDRVLFKSGEIFTGSLFFDRQDSGTPENPVTIGSYGEGRATVRSGSENGLRADNTSGFVVRDLVFEGAGADIDAEFSGILFYTDLDSVRPGFIRIDHVDVSGYRWEGIGIHGKREEGSSGFRDVRITHAKVHDNGDKGISVSGPMPEGDWGHKDVYIGNCVVFDNRGISGKRGHSGNGIIVSSVDGAMIEYCTAYNNGEFSDHPESGGPIGIWFWDTRNGIIQFCEAYNNKTGNQADGGGFDLDGGCVDCIMQYNYSHGNDGAGYGIYQYTNAREFSGNIIRYNISENDGLKNKYGGINLWSTNSSGGIRGTRIYNNTIFLSEDAHGSGIAEFPDEEGTSYVYATEVYNNLIVGVPGKMLVDIPFPGDGWTFKGNCYWTYGDKILIRWGDREYSSLDEWRKETGQERLGRENTGMESDPGLTDPGGGGTVGEQNELSGLQAYRLKRNSLLIDRGIDLGNTFGIPPGGRDFCGNKVPSGLSPDVGACEYVHE